MSFLQILIAVCGISVLGLFFTALMVEVDNEFVTFSAPMGFLVAVIYASICFIEKRKHPSEKKPLKGFVMVTHYLLLACFVLVICGSLMLAGITGSFLPLITGATFFFAAAVMFFYLEVIGKT
ncbi:MAG: hypothetical protein OXN17_18815 [Candidatus Poribacteria bacterium]|nr:hypothetical protein [Candidatus Poribacteria bacterium]MDE0506056.1 hypothetical protein [Candidatus Poribacteria bacterium]